MIPRRMYRLCCLLTYAAIAHAHMQLSWPYPYRSKYNPSNQEEDIDWSTTSPLNADGSNYPCKGYQNGIGTPPTATYSTGSTYNITLAGTITHGGGSCQLSLSYDNASTFTVIKSMVGGCPLSSIYDFTVPADAPTGQAIFAWTWQNLIGNREFYMNCAPVEIVGALESRGKKPAKKPVTKHKAKAKKKPAPKHHAFKGFKHLPGIFRGNLGSASDCVTTEGVNVVYPDPGTDVVYGDGVNDTSIVRISHTLIDTEVYKADTLTQPTHGDCTSTTSADEGSEQREAADISDVTDGHTYITTTMTVDCTPTLTLTTMPPHYTTSIAPSACTGT